MNLNLRDKEPIISWAHPVLYDALRDAWNMFAPIWPAPTVSVQDDIGTLRVESDPCLSFELVWHHDAAIEQIRVSSKIKGDESSFHYIEFSYPDMPSPVIWQWHVNSFLEEVDICWEHELALRQAFG